MLRALRNFGGLVTRLPLAIIISASVSERANAADLIVNGSFESGSGVYNPICPPWIFTGNLGIESAADYGIPSYDGSNLLTFNNGRRNPGGTAQQSIHTTAGTVYVLNYAFAGYSAVQGQGQSMTAKVLDPSVGLLTSEYTPLALGKGFSGWTMHHLTFKAASATTVIQFTDAGSSPNDSSDGLIDKVECFPETLSVKFVKSSYPLSLAPSFPSIKAIASTSDGSKPPKYSWTIDVHYNPLESKTPGGPNINLDIGPLTYVTDVPTFTPPNLPAVGGTITVTVSASIQGRTVFSSPSKTTVLGLTNPTHDDIKAVLGTNHLLWRICNWESHAVQFLPSGYPKWNVGKNNTVGDGGVGLMQVTLSGPTGLQLIPYAWNWRSNLIYGVNKWSYAVGIANGLPAQIQGTKGFIDLAKAYNDARVAKGLPRLTITMPPLTHGKDSDDPQQFERECIRVYNGVGGTDPVLKRNVLHEYTVQTDNAGHLVVTVSKTTLTGTASWLQVPESWRKVGDPAYVSHVLGTALL